MVVLKPAAARKILTSAVALHALPFQVEDVATYLATKSTSVDLTGADAATKNIKFSNTASVSPFFRVLASDLAKTKAVKFAISAGVTGVVDVVNDVEGDLSLTSVKIHGADKAHVIFNFKGFSKVCGVGWCSDKC